MPIVCASTRAKLEEVYMVFGGAKEVEDEDVASKLDLDG